MHIPVILTLERWRQKDQGIQNHPLLHNELEANLSYSELSQTNKVGNAQSPPGHIHDERMRE